MQTLLQGQLMLRRKEVALGENQLHPQTSLFRGEQKATGLIGIEGRLLHSQSNENAGGIGDGLAFTNEMN